MSRKSKAKVKSVKSQAIAAVAAGAVSLEIINPQHKERPLVHTETHAPVPAPSPVGHVAIYENGLTATITTFPWVPTLIKGD